MSDHVYEVQSDGFTHTLNASSAKAAAERVFRDEHDGCLGVDDDGYSQEYVVTDPESGESRTFRVIYYNCCEATEIPKEQA